MGAVAAVTNAVQAQGLRMWQTLGPPYAQRRNRLAPV